MDVQDHRKTTSSEHEIHGVHLCHKCGWPFPNPHPSAKHRRAHKKVCGKIEGYKLTDSESDHSNFGGSDNEHLSDNEQRTPSPKVEKGSTKELGSSGGMGLKSSRSEDELFSDAITEFSDNGLGPVLEERLKSVKQLDKNAGGELLHDLGGSNVPKNEKTADTSQPLHGLTQPPQGPGKASEMTDFDVAESERNTDISKLISYIGTENVSVGVSSTNGVECDSSPSVSEFVMVSENITIDNEIGKQEELISSCLGSDIKEKGKGSEALEIEHKLEEVEGKTSGPLVMEATELLTDKETSDPHIESGSQYKSNYVNGEKSHSGIADQEKELTNNLQSKHDVSSQIEPPKFEDASVVSEVKSDSANNLIPSSHGQSHEVCHLKEARNEDTQTFSAAEMLPAVENPEVMIGDFKDYKVIKSSFPLDLGAVEEIRSAGDDRNVFVPGNLPNALSKVPAGSVDKSSSGSSAGDHEKYHLSTPVAGEVGISVPENHPSALSSVPAGTVGNSSSHALEDDLIKDGVSTLIGWEVGTSVPENLPNAHSSIPAGTADNPSSEALEDDVKEEGVSAPIVGEVGTSVVPAGTGTVDNPSSEALEDNLEKKGVSTLICWEVGSVPESLPSVNSSVPAGTVDNSSSDALEDNLKKEGVSMLLRGEVGTSVPENLPSAYVPAGTADNTFTEALEDDLKRKGISTPINGEVRTSVPENIPSALSSVPAGTVDNSFPQALEDDLKKEGISRAIDREAGTSVPENLSSALSSVPAGTVDNSSSEDLEDNLQKEGVSTPIDAEVGTSAPENLSSVPAGAVDNSSSEALEHDLQKEAVSTSIDGEVGTSAPKNPPGVPAGTVENSSSEALEDNPRKEGVSIPIDEEVGAFRTWGTSDEDTHFLSVTETSPVVENPEVVIGDFKDYKVLKSSFPLHLEAAEKIGSVENDKQVTIPENLPSALSNVPAGSVSNASSDVLEDDLKQEGVSIPIDGEVDASGFSIIVDAHFGSCDLGVHPKTSGSETSNSQPNISLEGSLPESVDGKSLPNEDSEPTTREHSDVIPLESSTGEQTQEMTNLYGGENAKKLQIDELLCVATENGNMQTGEELSANITTTLTQVEAVPETMEKSISLAGDDNHGHENSRIGFSSIAGNETMEVAAEEMLVKHPDATHESAQQLTHSASLEEARGSNQVDIDARDSGKLCNSTESPKCCPDEIPNALEGLKMGDETEGPRSSATPGMVSELKSEDPTVPSEKTTEISCSKVIAAFAIESEFLNRSSASVQDMNIRDAIISGPLLSDGRDKDTKHNFSIQAADNSVVSSSRSDSLEGNWGSVSVLSTQSDVTAAADAEVISSTDSKAPEKIDGDFKKPQFAATERCPSKSDVFEPPSFMTLVESGVGVDKNAAASEIQTAQRDEQTKSEDLRAGWFPSITNVVNESEGRKKNEEVIAKVTNWSTGKQHSPLKNLLSEAQAETKQKSSNAKQVPAVNQADETASNNNGTAVTTVSSILGSEMPSADTVKKEMEKEWNSPARYPIQIKKEKRRGKPYWVPFVCCTSVHQDV